jgi:hypothetical protein
MKRTPLKISAKENADNAASGSLELSQGNLPEIRRRIHASSGSFPFTALPKKFLFQE